MIRIPTNRTPTHPGEMLLEEFFIPMGITQRVLATAIHVPYQRVNDLVGMPFLVENRSLVSNLRSTL